MKCIAVDDEPLALKVISDYIEKVPFLELKGTFENPFEALQVINNESIDIAFLDINMPGLTGIQLVKSLKKVPNLIFTTAYSEYAVEGFELDATDYLLKPFGFDRFLKAVNKIDHTKPPQTTYREPSQNALFVQSEHRMIRLDIKDIYYIEGFKEYVKIHTDEKHPLLTLKSLKSLEEQLEPNRFIRIHKSYLIAMDRIQEIRNGKVKVREKYLPIGDSYKKRFNDMVLGG
ncbi:MAG: LytTR family DNA-binding domain-containing protein [Bacteroidota bacterium]